MYVRNFDDIEEISQWLRSSAFLPDDLEPDVIHLFLSSVDGDKKKAKTILSNYYYIRQSIPEIFTRRHSMLKKNFSGWKGSMYQLHNRRCFFPLNGKEDGHQIFLGAILDNTLYNFQTFVKQMYMCYDLLIMSNDWDTGGRILVFAYQNIQYQNLGSFTMYLTKKAIECQKKNYLPGKLKAVHNIHVKPFMKNLLLKMKENLKGEKCEVLFHKNLQSLHNYINPDLLPLELGGNAGTVESIAGRWFQIIKIHKNFFIEEELKRIEETKAHRN